MTLQEFISSIDLHDGTIENIKYNSSNNSLKLDIELGFWKQSFYKEGEPEIGNIEVIFSDVDTFDLDQTPDIETVIDTEINYIKVIEENIIQLVLLDFIYGVEDVKLLTIEAKSVNWKKS